MAAVGLFGLLSYQDLESHRRNGIRVALGARRTQIQGLILRQIVALVAIGAGAGIALTLRSKK